MPIRRALIALLCLLPLSAAPVHASDDTLGAELPAGVRAVYPALVRIYVVAEQPGAGRMQRQRAAGSGVIVSGDGYVVTNHHVAGNATDITCHLSDRSERDATLVGTDPLADIAVLKLAPRADGRPFPSAPWGDSENVRVGQVVYAMGSPAAISQSVTRGIVANTRMIAPAGGMAALDGERVGSLVRWIAHDAAIQGGNSGGPLVDADGRIVGINEIGMNSLGGAIPSNLARTVVTQIIRDGSVARSWIGVGLQPRLDSTGGAPGVLVGTVVQDSPAARAGLRPGDVITRFGGTTVDSANEETLPLANQAMLELPPEQPVVIGVRRGATTLEVTLTTDRWERSLLPARELTVWGVVVRDVSRQMAWRRGLGETRGAVIDSIYVGGAAAGATPPLRDGDLIVRVGDQIVSDVASLVAATETPSAAPVLVTVDRDGANVLALLTPDTDDDPARPVPSTRRPWLGAETQVVTGALAEAIGCPESGMRVTAVADEASVLAVGDIVLGIDGTPVRPRRPDDRSVLNKVLRKLDVGATVTVDVWRDGAQHALQLTLPATPESAVAMPQWECRELDFAVRDLADEDRAELPDGVTEGVKVSSVRPASWAWLGGLRPDDVLLSADGQPVPSVDEARRLFRAAIDARRDPIILFVARDRETWFLSLEPKWDRQPNR